MAVLGFIGICGVLRTTDSPAPRALQWVAAALAVAVQRRGSAGADGRWPAAG
jgi:hypothetical protein